MAVHWPRAKMGMEFRREFEVIDLARARTRSYRFSDQTGERLKKLGEKLESKTETQILEDAVAHLLSTLDRDLPVYMTAPSDGAKRHKRTPSDAA
jgi:hypothetical protein